MTAERLTEREKEVLRMLAQGYGYKEIAPELGLAFDTVKRYCANIRLKLRARNSTNAVAIGIKSGVIE